MEVNDIFNMRNEGKVEEAYQAISDIHAIQQDQQTNLCMFWCCRDMLQLRIKEGRSQNARRFICEMINLYCDIDDSDSQCCRAISIGTLMLDEKIENFNLIYYMPFFSRLANDDWKPKVEDGHQLPSLGQQIVDQLLKDIPNSNFEYLNKVFPLFRLALRIDPHYKLNLRHYIQINDFLHRSNNPIDLYKRLLIHYNDSYLYAELAKLIDSANQKIALYCQALVNQKTEELKPRYHLQLAKLMMRRNEQERAAFEINRYIELCKKYGKPVSSFCLKIKKTLDNFEPVSNDNELVFYRRTRSIVDTLLSKKS